MQVTKVRPIPSLLMQTVPTNFVGKIGEIDVRIWQAFTPDSTNFLMAVAMLVPLEEISDYGLAVDLADNLDMHPGGLVDALHFIAELQAHPDGKVRDGDPPAPAKKKRPSWWEMRQAAKRPARR